MSQITSVLLGGALALAGSICATTIQARYQRRGAQDERMWSKRAQLYVDLLEPGAAKEQLKGRASAFASERVRQLFEEVEEAAEQVTYYASEFGFTDYDPSYEDRPEPDAELAKLLRMREQASERLRTQVRMELGTDAHGV